MRRERAAQALGVAVKDIANVEDSEHGTVVTLRGDGQRLIRDDGVYGWGDHPRVSDLPQYEPPQEPASEDPPIEDEQPAHPEPGGAPKRRPGRPRKQAGG